MKLNGWMNKKSPLSATNAQRARFKGYENPSSKHIYIILFNIICQLSKSTKSEIIFISNMMGFKILNRIGNTTKTEKVINRSKPSSINSTYTLAQTIHIFNINYAQKPNITPEKTVELICFPAKSELSVPADRSRYSKYLATSEYSLSSASMNSSRFASMFFSAMHISMIHKKMPISMRL